MSAVVPVPDSRPRLFFPESWPAMARAAVLLGLAVLLAYHNALSAPFVFEDLPAIVRNPTIRQLWPVFDVMLPAQPPGQGASPLVNLSFALNYALGGLDVTGYHVFNLLIHAAAALLLFGVTRRTFASTPLKERFGSRAFPLALAVALVWALHPLQTASVTNVVHRTELMTGLFLLLTLYAVIRATDAGNWSVGWMAVAVLSCLAGMATTPTMAVAPVLVFLYDRTFICSNWREALQRHGKLHLLLGATGLLLIVLLSRCDYRAGGATAADGVSGWSGSVIQARAVLKYLALSFWPEPLVFDYGAGFVRQVSSVLPQIAWLALLVGVTAVAVLRWPRLGFLGAWFLCTLGPAALALHEPALAEHRMYLPLAAVVIGAVAATFVCFGRGGLVAIFGLAIVCGGLTVRRNFDYESALAFWRDTVAKVPGNPRAHYNLANALSAAGRIVEAVPHYEAALRLEPNYAGAHFNLGGVLLQLGKAEDAVEHFRAALQHEPGSVDTHLSLAAAWVRLGRMSDAVTHYETAARSGLLAKEEQLRFGRALAEVGRLDEALVRLLEATRLNPNHAETRVVTGMVLSAAGRTTEALQHFTAAVVADPNDAEARSALADLLIESGRPSEALVHYEAALKLQPSQASTFHVGIGNALMRLGKAEEAVSNFESALQLNPDNQDARTGLRMVRAALQRRGLLKN